MTDRDALIKLLYEADMQRNDWDQSTYEAQADALLAAGWQAPRMSESDCEDQNGHEFYDTCAYCGADARDYFNRR